MGTNADTHGCSRSDPAAISAALRPRSARAASTEARPSLQAPAGLDRSTPSRSSRKFRWRLSSLIAASARARALPAVAAFTCRRSRYASQQHSSASTAVTNVRLSSAKTAAGAAPAACRLIGNRSNRRPISLFILGGARIRASFVSADSMGGSQASLPVRCHPGGDCCHCAAAARVGGPARVGRRARIAMEPLRE